MGLNDSATTQLADKEIVICTTIAADHPKTLPDAVTARTSTANRPAHLSHSVGCMKHNLQGLMWFECREL